MSTTEQVAPAAPVAERSGARDWLRSLARGSATPQRLRRVGAVLVAGCLLTAFTSLLGGLNRADAAEQAETRYAALTADAAELYRALADADAMATTGFVSGGREPTEVLARYDADIASASDRLAHAALLLPADDPAARAVATISARLPVYTGLVETARTYNRQGLPLGQSYLNQASQQMRTTILPAVDDLRKVQTDALTDAYGAGGAFPFAVLLIGIGTIVALVDVALLERRRTNRMLDVGVAVAGGAVVIALLWWVVSTLVAGARIDESQQHSEAAAAIDNAHAAALQARSNESIVLVARGGGTASEKEFGALMERVLAPGGQLDDAAGEGADVSTIRAAAQQWQQAHQRLRTLDDGGSYQEAVASATGTAPGSSGQTFAALDDALGDAARTEHTEAAADLATARGVLGLLPVVPTALALIAAGAAATGVARRIAEYR